VLSCTSIYSFIFLLSACVFYYDGHLSEIDLGIWCSLERMPAMTVVSLFFFNHTRIESATVATERSDCDVHYRSIIGLHCITVGRIEPGRRQTITAGISLLDMSYSCWTVSLPTTNPSVAPTAPVRVNHPTLQWNYCKAHEHDSMKFNACFLSWLTATTSGCSSLRGWKHRRCKATRWNVDTAD